MSLAILLSDTASVLQRAREVHQLVLGRQRSNLFGAVTKGSPVILAICRDVLGIARRRIEPGADGGAAQRQLVDVEFEHPAIRALQPMSIAA
jgi:hypothetical protein